MSLDKPWWIERHELGKNRNDPGDGFRYLFRSGTDGTEGRAEWFEVTEVFESVAAKDIRAFMRINNGLGAGFDFDPDSFVRGLCCGVPSRVAQRKAADKVIRKVEEKLNKTSYQSMWQKHGYGTLIVGLPLWFATDPVDPLRVENVNDDFMTRVSIGLEPYARLLSKKTCPFWRIVVVWKVSLESVREWNRNAMHDVYDDAAYRRIRDLPVRPGTIASLLELVNEQGRTRLDNEAVAGATRTIFVAAPKKRGNETVILLPLAVKEWNQRRNDSVKHRGMRLLTRAKWWVLQWGVVVLCFVRVHRLGGLKRWGVAKLSPRRRIARLAMRRRARRLYRNSRQRQASDRR